MAVTELECPECHAALRNAPPLAPGDAVQCPRCGRQFAVPSPSFTEAAAPRPTDSVGVRPADAVDDLIRRRPPLAYPGEPDDGAAPPPLSDRYAVEVGRWYGLASQNFNAVMWPSVGYILIAGVVTYIAAAPVGTAGGLLAVQLRDGGYAPRDALMLAQAAVQAGNAVIGVVLGASLWAGFIVVYLRQLRGRPWSFGDFFAGFRSWAPLAGVAAVWAAVQLSLATPVEILANAVLRQNHSELLPYAAGAALALLPLLVFLRIRLFGFTAQLVVDRGMGAMEAIRANWRLTHGHFWGLLGASTVVLLLYVVGALLCGIGILFTASLAGLTWNAGYLLITERQQPPPPAPAGPPPSPPPADADDRTYVR